MKIRIFGRTWDSPTRTARNFLIVDYQAADADFIIKHKDLLRQLADFVKKTRQK